jgi:hypothetical protein
MYLNTQTLPAWFKRVALFALGDEHRSALKLKSKSERKIIDVTEAVIRVLRYGCEINL